MVDEGSIHISVFTDTVYDLFPDAVIGQEASGEMVIHTGLFPCVDDEDQLSTWTEKRSA